jgi:hypothetical protein
MTAWSFSVCAVFFTCAARSCTNFKSTNALKSVQKAVGEEEEANKNSNRIRQKKGGEGLMNEILTTSFSDSNAALRHCFKQKKVEGINTQQLQLQLPGELIGTNRLQINRVEAFLGLGYLLQ